MPVEAPLAPCAAEAVTHRPRDGMRIARAPACTARSRLAPALHRPGPNPAHTPAAPTNRPANARRTALPDNTPPPLPNDPPFDLPTYSPPHTRVANQPSATPLRPRAVSRPRPPATSCDLPRSRLGPRRPSAPRSGPRSATRLAALLEAGLEARPDAGLEAELEAELEAGLEAGLEAELRVGDQLVVLLVAQPPSAKEAGGRGRARARTAVGLAQRRREAAAARLGLLCGRVGGLRGPRAPHALRRVGAARQAEVAWSGLGLGLGSGSGSGSGLGSGLGLGLG